MISEKTGLKVETKFEVSDCLSEPLTVLVTASEDTDKDLVTQQLQTTDGQSLILGTTSNAVTFNSNTTLTAVTLADGTQAFVAQEVKLDPGIGMSHYIFYYICYYL